MLLKIHHCDKCGKDFTSNCMPECPHPRETDTPEFRARMASICSFPPNIDEIMDSAVERLKNELSEL